MAIQLRAQKLSYEEIAQRCGYASRSACHDAVQRELDRTIATNVEQLRKEEGDGLDRLEALCWERIASEKHEKAMLFAVDRIVAIKERRAKLFGLDMPVQGDVIANQIVVRGMPVGYFGEESPS